jgi:hypothetical protein
MKTKYTNQRNLYNSAEGQSAARRFPPLPIYIPPSRLVVAPGHKTTASLVASVSFPPVHYHRPTMMGRLDAAQSTSHGKDIEPPAAVVTLNVDGDPFSSTRMSS